MKDRVIRFLMIVTTLVLAQTAMFGQAWNFSWTKGTDPNGFFPGHFETTPFPITEETTQYSITNDEGTQTFYLGTKYYVDAAKGSDGSSGLSINTPKKTITAAIEAAGSGNKTIIVRSGTYNEVHLVLQSGVDESRRFMIVGYGQERPVINGVSKLDRTICSGLNTAHATAQRLRIENNFCDGIITSGNDDSDIHIVDIWLYNNDRYDFTTNDTYADGNIKIEDTQQAWVYHCTSEHTFGHGIKISDRTSNTIVEWCRVLECGYWNGFPLSSYWGTHPSGIDFPSDSGDNPSGNICRYNKVSTTLYPGIYFRGQSNFQAHHNEVYDCEHADDVSGVSDNQATGHGQVMVEGLDNTSGQLYSNVIHNGGQSDSAGIAVTALRNGQSVLIFNNILYQNPVNIYLHGYSSPAQTTRSVRIYNNTLQSANATPLFRASSYGASEVQFANNILSQKGGGKCVELLSAAAITDQTNCFYSATNNIGFVPASGSVIEQPGFPNKQAYDYAVNIFRLYRSLAGTPLDSYFTVDADGRLRTVWSMGAFNQAESKYGPEKPQNIRVKTGP